MGDLKFSFQNVVDGNGVGIAITGMLIVFTALALITLFIALLPKILNALERFLPEEHEIHAAADEVETNEDEILVAIGYALHTKLGRTR